MAFLLEIDGVKIQTPKHGGYSIAREKVWSKDTGRSASTSMQGKILGVKTTLSITFPADMPYSEITKLNNRINSASEWHTIRFTNEVGITESGSFYFGTPKYDMYGYVNGKFVCNAISVDAVER